VKTEPYTGHKVKSYHTIYAEDGSVIDSHYEDTSDYKVRNKVVLVAPGEMPGAQVPAVNPTPLPTTPETPPAIIPAEPVAPEVPQEPVITVPDAPPVEIVPEEIPIIFAE